MDFLKQAASSMSGEKKQEKTNEPQQDYVDKGG